MRTFRIEGCRFRVLRPGDLARPRVSHEKLKKCFRQNGAELGPWDFIACVFAAFGWRNLLSSDVRGD